MPGGIIRVIDYAATQPNIPFMSIKVTGLRVLGCGEAGWVMENYSGSLIETLYTGLEVLTQAEGRNGSGLAGGCSRSAGLRPTGRSGCW